MRNICEVSKEMVWNKLGNFNFLIYISVISSNAVGTGTNGFYNKPNATTGIVVDSVVDISDTLQVPIRLEIMDETNIEIKNSMDNDGEDIKTQFKNQNDKRSSINFIHPPSTNQKISTGPKINQSIPECCLIIDPPKCDREQCVIRRKKVCWNVCTAQIMIREAPGFPKEKFPKQFIPPEWQTRAFPENLIISLMQPKTGKYVRENSNQPYSYQNIPSFPYYYQTFAYSPNHPAYHIPYYQNAYGQLPNGYYFPHLGHF